jgi:uncharacterized protein (DUF488 family)
MLTIGHSRHPIERFLELLREGEVEVLVDVRSQPVSRFSPHFSRKPLERAVTEAGMRYLFLGELLGGRPSAPECYDAEGKLDYDLVEAQPFFQRGIERLLEGEAKFRVCLLCAEENPASCHRRLLVSRALWRRAVSVSHLRGSGAVEREAGFDASPPQLSPPQLSLLPTPEVSSPAPRRKPARRR